MKCYTLILISLLALSSGGISLASLPTGCETSPVFPNNSYQMSVGEVLLSLKHTSPGGNTLMMYVPVGPKPDTLNNLTYVPVQADPMDNQTDESAAQKMNDALNPAFGPGQTVYIFYQLNPDLNENRYVFSINVVADGSDEPIFSTINPIDVKSTLSLSNAQGGQVKKAFSFPAKQSMSTADVGHYTVPAVPHSLPIEIKTNMNPSLWGHICFTGSKVKLKQEAQLYKAGFTIYPAPYVAPASPSVEEVQAIIFKVQKGKSTPDQLAKNIANNLLAIKNTYNSVDAWNQYVCPALSSNKLNVPTALIPKIAKNMNLAGVAYPPLCSTKK